MVTFVQLNNDFGTTQSKKEERNIIMSNIALLNQDGSVDKLLQMTSIPPNYEVPKGKIISWRLDVIQDNITAPLAGKGRPSEAHFYWGSAWGQINCEKPVYSMTSKRLRITIQGKVGSDVMKLRDYILCLIQARGSYWEPVNDLNPKPNFLERLCKWLSKY